MEFCGRCGKELGRDLDRGRFCAQCGHENPGNARYPLWDRSAAPHAPADAGAVGAATATAVALPRVSTPDDDATRVRMPSIPTMSVVEASAGAFEQVSLAQASAEPASGPAPVAAWRTALLAALLAMALVVVLGFALLLG